MLINCAFTPPCSTGGESRDDNIQVAKGRVPCTCQLLTFPTMKLKNKTKKQSVNLELIELNFLQPCILWMQGLLEYFQNVFPIYLSRPNKSTCLSPACATTTLPIFSVASSFASLAEIVLQVEKMLTEVKGERH